MGYTNEEFERMLTTILGGDYELRTERASAILKVVNDANETQRPQLLAFVLKNFGIIEDGGEPMKDTRMSDERFEELVKKLRKEVHRVFHVWVKKNPTEEELGKKLHQYLFGELTNEEERSVTLTIIMTDGCIPYRRIPDELLNEGLTSGDVKEALEDLEVEAKIKEDAAVIRSVLHRRNLTSATVMILWNIMGQHHSEAERFVMFHQILMNLEEEAKESGFGGLGNIGGMIIGLVGGKK